MTDDEKWCLGSKDLLEKLYHLDHAGSSRRMIGSQWALPRSTWLSGPTAHRSDWGRTRLQSEEPGAEPSARGACVDEMPDATGPVTKVRLWLRELVPNRVAAIGCPQLEGVYLLRLRQTPNGPRICNETWSLREGV